MGNATFLLQHWIWCEHSLIASSCCYLTKLAVNTLTGDDYCLKKQCKKGILKSGEDAWRLQKCSSLKMIPVRHIKHKAEVKERRLKVAKIRFMGIKVQRGGRAQDASLTRSNRAAHGCFISIWGCHGESTHPGVLFEIRLSTQVGV